MTIILVILLTLATVALISGGVGTKYLYGQYQKALNRKFDCPICGLAILDNSHASRMVHVLCITKTQDEIEAEKKKALETPKVEAPKPSDTKYTVSIHVLKSRTGAGTNPWHWDDETKQYLCYEWSAFREYKGYGRTTIDQGKAMYRPEAKKRAKAAVELDKQSNEVITL